MNTENQTDNLKLWHLVEKTNPKYTKNANVKGNKITSIAPQFQLMNATEQFGVYGDAWGFKDIDLDYSLVSSVGLIVFKAIFFFPNGSFPIINAISLYMDNARTKVDDNFAKKVETDALTKALSKLGFNADIFMGKFDDTRYVDEMNEEFGNEKGATTQTPPANTEPQKAWLNPNTPQWTDAIAYLKGSGTLDKIKVKYNLSKKNEEQLKSDIL